MTVNVGDFARERAFWDERYRSFGSAPGAYPDREFDAAITPIHEPGGTTGGLVHRRAHDLALARGIRGKRLLDYCCGRGQWAVHWARMGAIVSGFDASVVGVDVARRRASDNGVKVAFSVADARALPFPDDEFDLVVGISALEHVIKYAGSASELRRVIRGNGVAIFTENLGQNPAINLARRFTMHGQEAAGDVLLTEDHIRLWATPFTSVEIEGYNLLTMAKRLLPRQRKLLSVLHRADEAIFAVMPGARRFGGECVIVLEP